MMIPQRTLPSLLRARLLRASLLGAAAFAATTLAAPELVHAQTAADEKRLEQYLSDAVDDYDLVELADAERKLQDGIAFAAGKGIKGPKLAKLFIMLGIVRYARDRDEQAAEKAFVAAIEADPSIAIEASYDTPELSQIMASARKKAKPATATNTSAGDTSSKANAVKGFSHKPVVSAPGGQPLVIMASVSEDVPVFRMFVYHRRFGEETFQSVEMSPVSATSFSGVIPQNLVTTSQIDYYIIALDRAGKTIASAGAEDEPIEVLVRGAGDPDPEKVAGGGGGGTGKGTEGPEDPEKPATGRRDHVYIGIMGGSGLGFLPGGTPTARPFAGDQPRTVNPGVAATVGHTMLDLGVVLNPTMRLGLYARWQFSPPQDFDKVPESQKGGSFPSTKNECLGTGLAGDCLLGLKYRYYFSGDDPDKIRFYSSVGAGVGRMRHWVQLKENSLLADGNLNPECVGKSLTNGQDSAGNPVQYCQVRDTVRTGWGHFGLGAGVTIPLGSHVEFVTDTYLMFVTLDQTSINLDANFGFNLKF